MEKIKTIFIGTSDFGIPALRALLKDPYFELICAITQPDKKAGRNQELKASPIKLEAQNSNLKVLQPSRIIEALPEIKKSAPDIIVVTAYAQIIPEEILSVPRFGCVNIHASLLPKCRGATCIQGAILCGEKETGVTIMKMDKGLDTGPIIAQKSIPIAASDNAGVLFDKLSVLSSELLIPVLKDYIAGRLSLVAQNEKNKSYFCVLKKIDGRIDWTKPASYNEKFVRAMTPWPSAFSYFTGNGRTLVKIIETESKPFEINSKKPGELFIGQNKLFIQCGTGALSVKKIQLSGKNVLTAEEFIRGYSRYIGKILK